MKKEAEEKKHKAQQIKDSQEKEWLWKVIEKGRVKDDSYTKVEEKPVMLA